MVAMLSTTEESPEIVSVSKTNCLNWWVYGIGVYFFATFEDIKCLPTWRKYRAKIPSKLSLGKEKPLVIYLVKGVIREYVSTI